MNIGEKVLQIENFLIDYLTGFTWWTESRWEFTNIRWAKIIMLPALIFFAVGFWSLFLNTEFFWKALWGLLSALSFLFVFAVLFLDVFAPGRMEADLRLKYPQGLPNPNRVIGRSLSKRRESFIISIILIVLGRVAIFQDVHTVIVEMFFVPAFVLRSLYFFFLACDSLPTQRKNEMRKKREENRSRVLQPT